MRGKIRGRRTTRKQQRLFGADLARARAGKRTRTGLSKRELRIVARKPKGGFRTLRRRRTSKR